jgi:heme/copper-type cytochrome/quinol oxidase subunit 2
MGTLGLTGIVLGSLRLYGLAALVEHPYGETLAWKLALVATVLVPAAVNLLVVRPRLRHGTAEQRPVRLFQGMLATELAMGLGILILAGRLATTEPPLGAPLRLSVTLQDGAITPPRLEIPRNRPVLLTITNRGTQLHAFAVHNVPHRMLSGGHQHGASEDMVVFIEAGQTEKAQFVAYRSGTYQIYCMIEHHMDEGEQATLVVQP